MRTLLLTLIFAGSLFAQTTLRIDVSKTYQTIDHFGASDCWSFQKIGAWDEANKNRIADLLFSTTEGIGLSGWRFNIGGGINRTTIGHPWRTAETFEVAEGEYDWSRQAEERWFLQAAQERGVGEFVAFVNSPPGRMTRNGYTNGTDGLGSTNLKTGFEAQFATYLVDILKHFRDEEGIEFDHISPVNEPQWEWNNGCNQEGNRASNADIIAIVKALHAELLRQNVATQISISESGDIKSWHELNSDMTNKYGKRYGNYLQELIANPEITDKIAKHFGGHSYWSDRLSGQLVEHRLVARQFFTPFFEQGWSYWMTEYCILDGPEGKGGGGRDLSINTALDVARVIHYDLTHLDASAWSWWTAVSPENYKDGLIYTDYKNNPASQTIIESKTLWALGNFSRFLRPGAVRVRLSGPSSLAGLLGSAFLSPDRGRLFVIFVNMAEKEMPVTLQLSGFAEGNGVTVFTPFITSNKAGDDLKAYPAVSADSVYTVPARAVVTLVGNIENLSGVQTKTSQAPFLPRLLQNYPNPFNGETRIDFEVGQRENVQIAIFNQRGQKVITLLDGEVPAGLHSLVWDATDFRGAVLSSGLYFCILSSATSRKTIKLLLVR